jgi:DNA topoisomerase-1
VNEPCPKCDHPILTRKTTKDKGEHLACPKKGCGYTRGLDETGDTPDDEA